MTNELMSRSELMAFLASLTEEGVTVQSLGNAVETLTVQVVRHQDALAASQKEARKFKAILNSQKFVV